MWPLRGIKRPREMISLEHIIEMRRTNVPCSTGNVTTVRGGACEIPGEETSGRLNVNQTTWRNENENDRVNGGTDRWPNQMSKYTD